ncbi:MAG TPA: cell division protein FtsZ, partial [Candidatus Paceibacterota bacterium]
ITKPFVFEGMQRMRIAEVSLNDLKDSVDTMIVIPNDRILTLVEKETTFLSAFKMCDEILRQAVEGISDLITIPGIINVDFADVKTIMLNAGSALMGIGSAQGEDRAKKAAQMAINSPLLDIAIDGAKGVLFAISGGEDMTMLEIQEAANVITESIDQEAKVIFGAINDDRLKKGELKVTVIASGFPEGKNARKPSLFPGSVTGREKDLFPEQSRKESPSPLGKDKVETGREGRDMRDVRSEKEKERDGERDEDSWDAIPAFLRRKKN